MVDAMHVMASDEHFILNDIHNASFFENRPNSYMSQRDSLLSGINKAIYTYQQEFESKDIVNSFSRILIALDAYDNVYKEILEVYKKRGFRDFGLEGEMRTHIHILEDSTELNFNREWILTFRRYEKDYLLRKDEYYIAEFNKYFEKLNEDLGAKKKYSAGLEILDAYRSKFLELVEIEKTIGFHQNDGLRGELYEKKVECLDEFELLGNRVLKESKSINESAGLYFLLSSLGAIVLALIISLILSKRLSRPIKNLSDNIDNFLYKDWNSSIEIDNKIDILELDLLTRSYKKLVRQLKEQFEETQSKSEQLDLKNSELLKLGEEMDEFLTSSSRKLRAPLNSLQGLTELIRLGKLKANDDQTINLINEALGQIENYLKDFNEFVKLRKEAIKIEKFDFKESINTILNDKKRKALIPVNVNLSLGDDLSIESDKHRLELILSHVLDNAFQYYDRDIAKLNLLVEVKKSNTSIDLLIQDDGIGIEEDQLDRIFEMFFRASHLSKGSGLGLYIAKASLKSVGGKITIQSKVGEGTSVRIVIPDKPDF